MKSLTNSFPWFKSRTTLAWKICQLYFTLRYWVHPQWAPHWSQTIPYTKLYLNIYLHTGTPHERFWRVNGICQLINLIGLPVSVSRGQSSALKIRKFNCGINFHWPEPSSSGFSWLLAFANGATCNWKSTYFSLLSFQIFIFHPSHAYRFISVFVRGHAAKALCCCCLCGRSKGDCAGWAHLWSWSLFPTNYLGSATEVSPRYFGIRKDFLKIIYVLGSFLLQNFSLIYRQWYVQERPMISSEANVLILLCKPVTYA